MSAADITYTTETLPVFDAMPFTGFQLGPIFLSESVLAWSAPVLASVVSVTLLVWLLTSRRRPRLVAALALTAYMFVIATGLFVKSFPDEMLTAKDAALLTQQNAADHIASGKGWQTLVSQIPVNTKDVPVYARNGESGRPLVCRASDVDGSETTVTVTISCPPEILR